MKNGFALATGLVILALMTVLTTAAWRLASIDERSSAAVYHRGIVFQAAEAALRYGEELARRQANLNPRNKDFPEQGCQNGLCAPDPHSLPRWVDPNFKGWQKIDRALAENIDLKFDAEFIVEYLGSDKPCDPRLQVDEKNSQSNCSYYRITARSCLPSCRSLSRSVAVMLQSIYLTP